LNKKFEKIAVNNENNEIEEELNLDKIESNLVNNVIPKPEDLVNLLEKNTHFVRPRYIHA